jgi:hypothetical protein
MLGRAPIPERSGQHRTSSVPMHGRTDGEPVARQS